MNRKIFFVAAVFFLLLAMADIVLWIIISSDYSKSFETVVDEYVSLFPKIIATPKILTVLNILSLGIVICFFVLSRNKSKSEKFKKICLGLIIFSGILGFWNVFSLM